MEPNKASIPNSEDWTPQKITICFAMLSCGLHRVGQLGATWQSAMTHGKLFTAASANSVMMTLQAIINALNIDADYEKLSIDSTLLKAH